jgi:hypothetical protein
MESKMKSATFLLILLSAIRLGADDPVIPFDQYFISVETNDWLNRQKGFTRLNVSVRMHIDKVSPPKESTSVDVNCHKFPAGKRMFLDSDLQAFYEASAAAMKRVAFRKEIQTPTFLGKEVTVFETVEETGYSTVRVRRANTDAHFAGTEAEKVKAALREARAGEAWFKKLMKAEDLPKETADAKPPSSSGYYLSTTVGQVDCRGIVYEISVSESSSSRRSSRYEVTHVLRMINSDGKNIGSSSGAWVKELLRRVSEALEMVDQNQNYEFESTVERGRKFTVIANLVSRQVDVTWTPADYFPDRTPIEGHFDQMKTIAIQDLLDAAEARKRWFENHESLFYSPR